jgi:hypothetical protein
MGVRISCDMLAMNSVLALLASLASAVLMSISLSVQIISLIIVFRVFISP